MGAVVFRKRNLHVVLPIVGVVLLGVWLSSVSSALQVPPGVEAPLGLELVPSLQGVAPASALLDLEREVARLVSRLDEAPRPPRPVRNPFTLVNGPQVASPSLPLETGSPGSVSRLVDIAVEESVDVSLAGIGTERTPQGWQRTAVLSIGGRVFLASVGGEVVGRFRVRAITDDAVDLVDLHKSVPLRLVLP